MVKDLNVEDLLVMWLVLRLLMLLRRLHLRMRPNGLNNDGGIFLDVSGTIDFPSGETEER